jgi:hypothetical protein
LRRRSLLNNENDDDDDDDDGEDDGAHLTCSVWRLPHLVISVFVAAAVVVRSFAATGLCPQNSPATTHCSPFPHVRDSTTSSQHHTLPHCTLFSTPRTRHNTFPRLPLLALALALKLALAVNNNNNNSRRRGRATIRPAQRRRPAHRGVFSTSSHAFPGEHANVSMEPRRRPEYNLDIFADLACVKDVVKGESSALFAVHQQF